MHYRCLVLGFVETHRLGLTQEGMARSVLSQTASRTPICSHLDLFLGNALDTAPKNDTEISGACSSPTEKLGADGLVQPTPTSTLL